MRTTYCKTSWSKSIDHFKNYDQGLLRPCTATPVMAPASIVRRALLYVPGSSAKFIEKSRNLNVDCIAYDLEDSVAPGKKAEARVRLRELFQQPKSKTIREQAVRINSVDSGLALDDLTEVVRPSQSTLMVLDI